MMSINVDRKSMQLPTRISCIAASIVLQISATTCFAATDQDLLAEARLALDVNDCRTALVVARRLSEQGQKDPVTTFYLAKIYECLGDSAKALAHYESYNQKIPNEPQIAKSIAELKFKLKWSWKKGFCEDLRKVVLDFRNDFRNFRGRKLETTKDNNGELTDVWEGTFKLARPEYRLGRTDEPDKVRFYRDTAKTPPSYFTIFYSGDGSSDDVYDFVSQLNEALYTEVLECLRDDYTVKPDYSGRRIIALTATPKSKNKGLPKISTMPDGGAAIELWLGGGL